MRPASPDELRVLARAFEGVGTKPLEEWMGPANAAFWIRPADGRVFLVPARLSQALAKAPAPHTLGLPVGRLDGNRFIMDLEGAYVAATDGGARVIRIADHAAQLFLYGRDILTSSLEDRVGHLTPGQLVLVANRRGECLGLARFRPPARPDAALVPVIDRGWYLREGG